MAAIVPNHAFNAEKAAQELRKAMKGFGADEKAIINILVSHSNKQRQEIRGKFKALFGRDLIDDLKSELKGNLEDCIVAMMYPPTEYLARELRNAMKGVGTDEKVLIEILCARNNRDINLLKLAYKTHFKGDLEKDIMSETSGHFKSLLVSQVNAGRDESTTVEYKKVEQDTNQIIAAGIGQLGTDEAVFNMILCSRSFPHLKAVFRKYKDVTLRSISDSISSEMRGDLKEGFLTIVDFIEDPIGYFAERLYKSMKGIGTDDNTLIRVIVSRSEIDLMDIKKCFQKKYGKSLKEFIEGDCSGDYKKLLLAILRESDQ